MIIIAWVKAKNKSVSKVISNDNSEYDRAIGMDYRGGGQGWSCSAGNNNVLGSSPAIINQ